MITQRAIKRSANVQITLTKNKNNQSTLDLASMNLTPFTDTDKMTEGIFCSLAVDSCKKWQKKTSGNYNNQAKKDKSIHFTLPSFFGRHQW